MEHAAIPRHVRGDAYGRGAAGAEYWETGSEHARLAMVRALW